MLNDMTSGSPMKLILTFTIPMLIGSVFQQLYNMVDSIVVGRFVGPQALAAVGTSSPIIFMLIALVMGLTTGVGIIISQFFGAKRYEDVRRAVSTALIFQLIGALVMTVVGTLASRPLLELLRTPADVINDSAAYMRIYFLGLIFMFTYNAFAGILRALGDSRSPLYFLIVSTLVNVVLDIYFVANLGWGVAGVAWATLIAQAISVVLCIFYIYRRVPILQLKRHEFVFDRGIFATMIKVGIPSSIQQTVASMGFMAVQGLINSFGSTTMAAYTAAARMDSFAMMPIMSLGMAVSTYSGQNIGADKMDRVRHGVRSALILMVIACLFVSVLVYTLGPQMIAIFVDADQTEVISRGVEYMRTVSLFYIVFGIMGVFNGVLRGAGDTSIPMVTVAVDLAARVIAAYWLVTIPSISYRGTWWAIPVGWCVSCVIPMMRYLSGAWKAKAVIRQQMFATQAQKAEA